MFTHKCWLSLFFTWNTACVSAAKQVEKSGLKSNDELATKIDLILEKAYENHKFAGLSIIVRSSDSEKMRKHYGYRDIENGTKPDDFTLYEIGSISKVFTRLLLALDTRISLKDSIRNYLPENTTVPAPGGQDLRIQDLALHTGFRFSVPCVPKPPIFDSFECFGYDANDEKTIDPYRLVTDEKLLEYVDAYGKMLPLAPTEQFPIPGSYYEYSNTGMGLLGRIVAKKYGKPYEEHLKDKILIPLGMKHTYIAMPCEDERSGECQNLARVYRGDTGKVFWKQSSLWHMNGLVGAGAIRSSLADMGKFLDAEMALVSNLPKDLRDGIRRSKSHMQDAESDISRNLCGPSNPNKTTCNSQVEPMYFGWPADSNKVTFFHAGQTGSSQSMIMMSQDGKFGLIILTNSTPSAKGTEPDHHVPNDLALCIFQLAGRRLGPGDFCKSLEI